MINNQPTARNQLDGYKVDVSHQELSRIIRELEDFSDTCPTITWISIDAAVLWLCQHLGYEDERELEDALHGKLETFLTRLPHFEIRRPEPGSEDQTLRFRSNLRDHAPGRPCKITFRVETPDDLWRVMLKPQGSWVEIPELEFEIGRNDARQVDTIYSYIGEAIYNLGQFLQANKANITDAQFDGISATILTLNVLLDVEKPFTWVVYDPTGTVAFKPHAPERILVEFTELAN